jgi:hypothetical protein
LATIKIYTDQAFLPPNSGHLELLYPFWGKIEDAPMWWGLNIYDNYCNAEPVFELTTNPAEADFALLPNDWKRYERNNAVQLAQRFNAIAVVNTLKTIVVYHSDSDFEIPLKRIIAIRTSLIANQRQNEFALPGWNGDLLSFFNSGIIIEKQKSALPSIGFCGASKNVTYDLKTKIKEFIKRKLSHKNYRFNALQLRHKIMGELSRSKLVDTNFIYRDSYLAGLSDSEDKSALLSKRREYFDNMIESDYVLCIRGAGNFSYRFYEVLSVGRIPVFINTQCALPFDWIIPYKELFVWIEEHELDIIDKKIAAFHNGLTQEGFIELQHKLRALWQSHLSPEGFMNNFHLILTKPAK